MAIRYTDDAGIVAVPPDGLATEMVVVMLTSRKFGLAVSESKTESIPLRSLPISAETALHISTAGQRYKQTIQFVYCKRDCEIF